MPAESTLRLAVQPSGMGQYEYRWLLKRAPHDWDWSAQWRPQPVYDLSPASSGIYSLQVDIRRRGESELLARKWLGDVRVIRAAGPRPSLTRTAPTTRAADDEQFEIPTLPAYMQVGEAAGLRVQPPAQGHFEYQWLVKYGPHDWDWSRPWLEDSAIVFTPKQPGVYALHVNVRDRGTGQPRLKRSLDQVTVQGRLVEDIYHSPLATALPVGTAVEFFLSLSGSPNDLEFRLWDLQPTEQVVHDWQAWPLPPYVASEAKLTALQIDVRLKDAPSVLQHYWINSFQFFDPAAVSQGVSLLRCLIADDTDFDRLGESIDEVGEQLDLITALFSWESEALPAAAQLERLSRWPLAVEVQAQPAGEMLLTTARGRRYFVDLASRIVRQQGSPLMLRARLAEFPRYQQALALLASLSEPVRRAALLNYAVYEGYQYGTPARSALLDLNQPISHCSSQSMLLHALLGRGGLAPELLWVVVPDGRGGSGSHSLVQVRISAEQVLLLDASSGFVYVVPEHWAGSGRLPDPIILPPCRTMSFLDLRQACSAGCSVSAAAQAVPNVVPLRHPSTSFCSDEAAPNP